MKPFSGLTEADAAARLQAEGHNELPQPDRRTPFRIAIEVLREPMLALLLVGGIVYLALGDLKEAIILVAFATMSIVITVVQETRTERVLEALRDLTSPRALVIRDGERKRIAGRDVVRGDLIVLSEGDRVPADAVLLRCTDLQADEFDPDRRIRAGAQGRLGRSRQVWTAAPGRRRPAAYLLRFAGGARLGAGGSNRHRCAKRNRQDRPVAGHPRNRTAAPAGANTARRQAVCRSRRRGQRARGAALRHHARRMAGRGAGRNCAGHVDAAGRVSGRPDRLHGDGRMANFAGARPDAARGGDRDAGLCHRAVHRQDRHPHRKPDDDRRAAAEGWERLPPAGRHGNAGAVPGLERVRPARERARAVRPDGAGVPYPGARAADRGRLSASALEAGARLWSSARSPRRNPYLASGWRPAGIPRRHQGRSRSDRRSLPAERSRPRGADAIHRCDGLRRPACAGRCARHAMPGRLGRHRRANWASNSWDLSASPIRCAPASSRRSANAGPPASRPS